jgi:hypothetical protein
MFITSLLCLSFPIIEAAGRLTGEELYITFHSRGGWQSVRIDGVVLYYHTPFSRVVRQFSLKIILFTNGQLPVVISTLQKSLKIRHNSQNR